MDFRKPKRFVSTVLVVFLFSHQTSPALANNINVSEVESFDVRRLGAQDVFTVNMKSTYTCTKGTVYDWCLKLHGYTLDPHDTRSCKCICFFSHNSFVSPLQKCVNAAEAASFGGCTSYFGVHNLLAYSAGGLVNLNQTATYSKTFFVFGAQSCSLSGSYFVHDYSGFHSRWEPKSDGFFTLNMSKIAPTYKIVWSKADTNGKLSGRIIRLHVTCTQGHLSSTSCILLKAKGRVIYSAPPATSTAQTTISNSLVGSNVSSKSATSSLVTESSSLSVLLTVSPSTSSASLPPSTTSASSSSTAPSSSLFPHQLASSLLSLASSSTLSLSPSLVLTSSTGTSDMPHAQSDSSFLPLTQSQTAPPATSTAQTTISNSLVESNVPLKSATSSLVTESSSLSVLLTVSPTTSSASLPVSLLSSTVSLSPSLVLTSSTGTSDMLHALSDSSFLPLTQSQTAPLATSTAQTTISNSRVESSVPLKSATSSLVTESSSLSVLLTVSPSTSSASSPPSTTSASSLSMQPSSSLFPHQPASSSVSLASSTVSLSPSLVLTSSTRTSDMLHAQSDSSFLSLTQSQTARLPALASIQATTSAVNVPIEPAETATAVSSSSAADSGPGNIGSQNSGNDNRVIIGAAVGGAAVIGVLIIIFILFWKRRKAWESTEKQTKPVKIDSVYGSSSYSEIQLEVLKESKAMPSVAQDNEPRYQSLIGDNRPSNRAAVYSSAEVENDYCTVYQSLDKQIPGRPVYGRLNRGLLEPDNTTGLPKPKPKARTSAAGIPTSKANGVTGMPKPNPKARTRTAGIPTSKANGVTGMPKSNPKARTRTAGIPTSKANGVTGLPKPTRKPTPKKPIFSEAHDSPAYKEALSFYAPYAAVHRSGPSNRAAVYSSAEVEKNNCTVYQILDKQIPGRPVYGRLNRGLLDPDNATGLPKPKTKARTRAAGIPTSKANGVTGLPKRNRKPTPKRPISLQAHDNPAYKETPAFHVPYAAVHRPGPSNRAAVYSSAEVENNNWTVYQSLDKQIPGRPVHGRLNKVLLEPDNTTGLPKPKTKARTRAAGIPTSKANSVTGLPKRNRKPTPIRPISLQAHDNPAYKETPAFYAPYAAVHRPGTQTESFYEPLRGRWRDQYESIG